MVGKLLKLTQLENNVPGELEARGGPQLLSQPDPGRVSWTPGPQPLHSSAASESWHLCIAGTLETDRPSPP